MNAPIKLTLVTLIACLSMPIPLQAKGSAAQNTIGDAEINTLLIMREEEKLARDAYQILYGVWEQAVFKNIAASEQKHTDAILKKINLYGLTDPAFPEAGRFSNPTFQTLYDQFLQWVRQGNMSYIDALGVGATVEDWDIKDLNAAIEATNNLALKTTYQNLLEASKQHLRTFVGLLQEQGVNYRPQFIDQTLFDAILDV
ncbi:MAG: DUF2202 domain-containing protein [Methylococcales bacterium]|nr:DUF2202 domain-containing protein [Methylococcales bacterium]